MQHLKTDYWKEISNKKYDALVCTINQILNSKDELVMGKGIALEFNTKYSVSREWGRRIKLGQKKIPLVNYNDKGTFLVGLPTKIHWRDSSPESLVIESCEKLKLIADSMDWANILMTRPGCGLGGLQWNNLKYKLEFLDDRFVVVYN